MSGQAELGRVIMVIIVKLITPSALIALIALIAPITLLVPLRETCRDGASGRCIFL